MLSRRAGNKEGQSMTRSNACLALLMLLAGSALPATAQVTYAPPDIQLPIPTGSTRPEEGGLDCNTSFVLFNVPPGPSYLREPWRLASWHHRPEDAKPPMA